MLPKGRDQDFSRPEELAPAQGDLPGLRLEADADPGPLGEPDSRRVPVAQGGLQHPLELAFVLGRHDDHVGQMTEIDDVVHSLVGRTLIRNDAGPVEGQDDRQVLEGDIMIELVISPLHKC